MKKKIMLAMSLMSRNFLNLGFMLTPNPLAGALWAGGAKEKFGRRNQLL
jgi:hypothetical protein